MSYILTNIIGAGSGWGAQKRATEHGPDALQHFGLVEKLKSEKYSIDWGVTLYPESRYANDDIHPKEALDHVIEVCEKVYHSVQDTIKGGDFPCVVGGDHSIAIGTWSSTVHALNAQGEFGLIWFDAHLDAHTPKTSPSNAYHGMPVATLLGYGEKVLTHLGDEKPKLKPEHVVVIGARSYEEGEHSFLNEHGVKIFYMDDIKKLGFAEVLRQAIEIASKGTKGFGLSLDLDGFDPEFAPGVGSPEPGGLSEEEVLPALSQLRDHPQFKAFEITEYNPHFDIEDKTAHLVLKILQKLVHKES